MSVDLNVDPSLQIDIPDALSERDKVKFTVHTKVSDRMTSAVKAAPGHICAAVGVSRSAAEGSAPGLGPSSLSISYRLLLQPCALWGSLGPTLLV